MHDYTEQDLADLTKRQRYAKPPQKMGDLVAQLMARRGYAQSINATSLADAWREAAGALAEHSRPGNVKRGTLEVFARDSATMQELAFQKKRLLAQIQRLAPDQKITALRFRVGQIE